VIIFVEAHEQYKNNLLIFLQIAGPEAILIKRSYCTPFPDGQLGDEWQD
jgi:hypothetical protein